MLEIKLFFFLRKKSHPSSPKSIKSHRESKTSSLNSLAFKPSDYSYNFLSRFQRPGHHSPQLGQDRIWPKIRISTSTSTLGRSWQEGRYVVAVLLPCLSPPKYLQAGDKSLKEGDHVAAGADAFRPLGPDGGSSR